MNLRGPLPLVVASSAWIAIAGNAALWRELQSLGLAGGWLAPALAGVIAACLIAILSALAWRPTLKPAIFLVLLATAVAAHFMARYGIVIDRGMLVNALETDRHESGALMDAGLVATVALLAILPAFVVWRWPVAYRPAGSQAVRNVAAATGAALLAVACIGAAFGPLASAMRNHKQLRYLMNPLNSIYAGARLLSDSRQKGPSAAVPLGRDASIASTSARPPLLVLVIGETARSANFGLNGYARQTTPRLAAAGAVSFRNAWSCGTSTAASLPCMFSHLGRDGFASREAESENLLDVLRHAGFSVLWLDNQSGCKGVCDRVPHESTPRGDSPFCASGECLDEALLERLDSRLAAMPAAQRDRGVVLVLHQMGSHGPAYSLRSPPRMKRFAPECASVNLQECANGEIVNAYDNSILYTDHVLGKTIAWLRTQSERHDTAMLYVSDHGESLGESGLYLHGMPWRFAPDSQKHVPWVTWLSAGFEGRTGVTMECLRSRVDAPVSHDNLFHSVLGLMGVRTVAYSKGLDVYADCGGH